MKNEQFLPTVERVSTITIVINVLLSVFKLCAGIFARSGAMISDGIHSASDVFSTVIVMIGARISSRSDDKEHPYGHERFECVAAIILALILAITGLSIGYNGIRIIASRSEIGVEAPGMLALIAAIVSIVVKEAMFWYTRYYAKKVDSSSLMANAWHHRSDALSSVGALAGIGGAILGYPILDPIASVVICLFILKVAYDIFKDALNRMVDRSCDQKTEDALRATALSVEGVKDVDLLHTRLFGNRTYVELEIACDGEQKLKDAHAIAEKVHSSIEHGFPEVKHVTVHVNPTSE